ncbi:MAG TPA: methylenetetrahydrofolate reductase [NAD(P)H] [Thermodesulfovibrionales bacterium]|nr:methylenetetrahydrofolate reductase [NAD(P)H] [Thermodesulfovibrionales bacterium]
MRISDKFKGDEKRVSFEFFPPKSVESRRPFMNVVNALKRYDPLYVSVTYGSGGSTRDRTGTTLKWIKEETDLTVMSHLTCIGATTSSIDALLKDYMASGIDNILAMRGDPPRDVADFDPAKGEFRFARDLVAFIKRCKYFSIAVAVYPEGHQESPSIEKDMEYTKAKIDEGADFAITQMFFDNRYYYDFLDRAAKEGITIPILPGIMPITDCRKIEEFADFCNATIPQDIKKKMEPLLDKPEEMRKLGVEYAVRQCEDLLDGGVRYLHFYTMNRADSVGEILDALGSRFLRKQSG